MIYALYTIHIAISFFLVMVVLFQSGRSADLSALGGGATQTTFGARGTTNLLHRLTVVCFVLFILTTLGIGIFQSGGTPSVMSEVEGEATTDSTPQPANDAGAEQPPAAEAAAQGSDAAPVEGAEQPTSESESNDG